MFILKLLRPKKTRTTNMSENIQVCLYKKNNELETLTFDSGITCENICISCCKSLNILPTTRLLFGLREVDSGEWLFPCKRPETNFRYEFRMRFKVPELDNLYAIDPNAYDYMYFQIRHDMVHDQIDDIQFPKNKDKVVGLGAVDMYIDYTEKKCSIESIEENYKQYLPENIIKKHSIFAKKAILYGFEELRKTTKKLNFVKSSYMYSFAEIAPNYLREKFNVIVQSLPDGGDSMDQENYPVTIDLDLYGDEGPSIKITLFKTQVFLLTKLENLNALYLNRNQLGVDLDINGHFRKYHLEFKDSHLSKSFMTYVSGYLRLTTKWMFDPCVNFPTPSLMELKAINCHGPVGGDFSYSQIRESGKGRGTFIVRQCELEYDTYYIDIIGKLKQTETFKITGGLNEWFLHMNESVQSFPNLLAVALAIPTDTKSRYQIPVSDYDKPPLLLICVPRNLRPKTTDNEVNQKKLQEIRRQIFDPKKDLQLYIHTQSRSDCGKMTCHSAEWVQPSGIKNVKVMLKVLNDNTDFTALLKLSNTWGQIFSADFLKMYGQTLTPPYAVVLEHPQYGPLNKFLQKNQNVSFRCLLDITNCLFRAVGFMQEKKIFHGQIRCSSLMVTHFCPEKNLLVAKLADPGIRRVYEEKDLPWIPINLYEKLRSDTHFDIYSDLWAFATTVWEIFARGQPIQFTVGQLLANYRNTGAVLEIPEDWPEEIRAIIMNGWSLETDIRFDKMEILSKLSNLQGDPDIREANQVIVSHSTSSNGSENPRLGRLEDDPEDDPENDPEDDPKDDESLFCAIIQRISEGKLIRKQQIGEGFYGRVYRGELHYNCGQRVEAVAIKHLINNDADYVGNDFQREIQIMRSLKHPNIVRIITFTRRSPMSIVMEYLNGRSLKNYIRQHPNLPNEKLLKFALQIAKGMEYLGERGIIHRDLAARNVLVDGEIVKISDFGLAQHANENGNYYAVHKRALPIKWYAIESLEFEIFSSCSDVWSYGVTLFEIFSKGNDPDLEGAQDKQALIDKLKNGDRLKKHERCPQIIYEKLMVPCWHEEKKKRPTFTEIITTINNVLNEHTNILNDKKAFI